MKKTKYLFSILITLSILLSNCSGKDGEDGEIGPTGPVGQVGPKGDKGDKGDKGEKGDSGDKGESGNANVKSYTFKEVYLNPDGGEVELTLPDLTEEIFTEGLVYAYWTAAGNNAAWYPLPYDVHPVKISLFHFRIGYITIKHSGYLYDNIDLRVIMIPSNSNTNMRISPDIDFTNYNQVKSFFNLEE